MVSTIVNILPSLAIVAYAKLGKAKDLVHKQEELADVNRKQAALANLKTEFEGLKPDIALICNRLVLFAEIWASVGYTPLSLIPVR
jgi:hypothetical protein